MYDKGFALGSRYVLDERVATGGMGEVWRAQDTVLNRDVAIKLLRRELVADPASRARLTFEAQAVAAIDSQHVVRVYDYGHLQNAGPDEVPYLVMEFVDGEPLRDILKREGHLSPARTAKITHEVALGLAATHHEGLVHRDVKPGNILIANSGLAKITDFGIAHGAMSNDLTQTGTLVGTAKYLAPEQVEGEPATSATDVYALGVVAFECVAGYPPFAAETDLATALLRLRQAPEPLPTAVPLELSGFIGRMLSKSPSARPDLEEVIAAMAAASTSVSISTDKTRTLTRSSIAFLIPTPRRGRRVWGAGALACTLLAGITAVTLSLAGNFGNGSPSAPLPTSSANPAPEAAAVAATSPAAGTPSSTVVNTEAQRTATPTSAEKPAGKPSVNPGNGKTKAK